MCQTPDNAPCGHCHACHLMAAQSHPDFHVLVSQEGKDIGVDQVRAINEVVSQHAQQNGNKLVYIQDAERLTEAAANALLKTLEEPRPNTYFLLQTEPSSSLLATIYSRCQVWILAFLSDAIKYKLEIQSGWQTLDLKTGVIQFADEQTALGLLTANKIMQKVRSDLLTINGVNTELMLLDGLTKLITDVFKD